MNRDTIIQQNILKALAYFDIFRYPLTAEEITLFLHSPATVNEVYLQALILLRDRKIFAIAGLYMLQDDAVLAERRKKGNQSAVKEMEKAQKIARWLFCFPFVRSIAVSGSLSKNYADEHTDIDFFVITAGGRLWLTRTLLHILYKLPRITRKRRPFCLNYYIDDAVMEIEEKNIFTATEIITLLPLEGQTTFKQFKEANSWVNSYYPQHSIAPVFIHNPGNRLKRLLEALFSNRFGNWLEQRLMQATQRRWQQKMQRNAVNEKGLKISMKSGAHYAKPDPENFQRNIINLYEQRLKGLNPLVGSPAESIPVVKPG